MWGDSIAIENDFLRDLDGHGWHLHRARFENWLREVSVRRGAIFLTPARLQKVERSGRRWSVTLDSGEEIRANLLIDASGRGASLARRLGARVLVDDFLTCRWVSGHASGSFGVTVVEAVEDGWWYTAPTPHGNRVLAFHSGRRVTSGSSQVLLKGVAATLEISRILKEGSFVARVGERVAPAFSATLCPCVGDSWLAIGDAALSFDPISSQGLLNALFTGLAAAEAAARSLSGETNALFEYSQMISDIHARYRRQLDHWYRLETRWPKSPFWRERYLALEKPKSGSVWAG